MGARSCLSSASVPIRIPATLLILLSDGCPYDTHRESITAGAEARHLSCIGFLENDGTLEAAQRIAGHADSRTTKLYDRRGQKVLGFDFESNFVTAAVWTYAQPLARIAADCLLFLRYC